MSNPLEKFNQARLQFVAECEEFDKAKESWQSALEKQMKSQQKIIAEQMTLINFLVSTLRKDDTPAPAPEAEQPDNVQA